MLCGLNEEEESPVFYPVRDLVSDTTNHTARAPTSMAVTGVAKSVVTGCEACSMRGNSCLIS